LKGQYKEALRVLGLVTLEVMLGSLRTARSVVWSNQRTLRPGEFQVLPLSRATRNQDGVAWVRGRDTVHIYRNTQLRAQEQASKKKLDPPVCLTANKRVSGHMPSLVARDALRISTVADELFISFHVTKRLDHFLFYFFNRS